MLHVYPILLQTFSQFFQMSSSLVFVKFSYVLSMQCLFLFKSNDAGTSQQTGIELMLQHGRQITFRRYNLMCPALHLHISWACTFSLNHLCSGFFFPCNLKLQLLLRCALNIPFRVLPVFRIHQIVCTQFTIIHHHFPSLSCLSHLPCSHILPVHWLALIMLWHLFSIFPLIMAHEANFLSCWL